MKFTLIKIQFETEQRHLNVAWKSKKVKIGAALVSPGRAFDFFQSIPRSTCFDTNLLHMNEVNCSTRMEKCAENNSMPFKL